MEPYTVLQLHPGTNLILICLSTLCRIMMRIGLMYYLMDILSGFVPGGNEWWEFFVPAKKPWEKKIPPGNLRQIFPIWVMDSAVHGGRVV